MKITLLKYNTDSLKLVFESGEYLLLPVDIEYVTNLSAGKEISDEYFLQLKKASDTFKCRRHLFRYLSGADKSVFEAKRYLKKKQYEQNIIEVVVSDFIDKQYLNDERFAEKYISYILRNRIVGKMYIYNKLSKKGIKKDIILRAMEKVMPVEVEISPIKDIAVKKLKSIQKKKNKYSKVVYFLQSRGFSSEIVYKVTNEMKEEGYSFED